MPNFHTLMAWATPAATAAFSSVSPVMLVFAIVWMGVFIFLTLVSVLGKRRQSKQAMKVLTIVYGRREQPPSPPGSR